MVSTVYGVASEVIRGTLRPPAEMIARIRKQCRTYLGFDLGSYRAGMGCCALMRPHMLTQGKPAAYDLQQFGNPCPSLAIDRYALVADIRDTAEQHTNAGKNPWLLTSHSLPFPWFMQVIAKRGSVTRKKKKIERGKVERQE